MGMILGEVSTEYLSLAELAQYCSVGKKTLNKWLRNGMPYYRVGRLVRVRRSEFDAWMKQFRRGTFQDLDAILEQVMKEV
jgi:excisionase family DNA binding protein